MGTCKKCGKETPRWGRCDDCLHCDECGTREGVCQYVDGVWCDYCRKGVVDIQIAKFTRSKKSTESETQCICPWCGYVSRDAWESSEGETECSNCERDYDMSREVVAYYTTKRIEKPATVGR